MTRRLLITAAWSALALVSLATVTSPTTRADDGLDAVASSPPAAPSPPDTSKEPVAVSDERSTESSEHEPASSRHVAASKPTFFGRLAKSVRNLLDPPSASERPSANNAAHGNRGRNALSRERAEPNDRGNTSASTAADPEPPLPIATRSLPKQDEQDEPTPSATSSPQPESVVAARLVASAEKRRAEAGESGLSPEPVAPQPGVGPERMSIEQLLGKGASSLQVNAVSLAGSYFREAIAEAPDDPQVVARAGVLALKYNRPELAVDLIEPAIPRFSNTDSLRQVLAMAKYRRGEYLAARALLLQALAVDKSSALSHYVLGCTLVKLDQRELAESHLRQAAQLDPKYASLR